MSTANNIPLAPSTETGSIGICHLKRLWSKAIAGPHVDMQYPGEKVLDNTLIDILGTGLLPTYRFLYEQRPDFESFEQWVIANGTITANTIKCCNALLGKDSLTRQFTTEDVLTAADIAFWEEHGYVIVKNAVSGQECADSRKAIMDFLKMDEHDAASWYKRNDDMHGIMVNLYNDAAINKNRNSARIRRAFEQLWNRTDLVVTADKCGFNPPETETFKYMGTGLHWDVSLATPIPFGTQGILYLTDTAANQGALTVVPGFHINIESWLHSLPENQNPRETDLSSFGPRPVAANAGDLIIWDHRLPHSASPNHAALPRIVQYINWYAALEKIQLEWK